MLENIDKSLKEKGIHHSPNRFMKVLKFGVAKGYWSFWALILMDQVETQVSVIWKKRLVFSNRFQDLNFDKVRKMY